MSGHHIRSSLILWLFRFWVLRYRDLSFIWIFISFGSGSVATRLFYFILLKPKYILKSSNPKIKVIFLYVIIMYN